jgi:hypothetical protein
LALKIKYEKKKVTDPIKNFFHKTVELDYNYLFLTSQLQIFLKAHFSPDICYSTPDVNFRFFQRTTTANGNRVKLRGIKISRRYSLK